MSQPSLKPDYSEYNEQRVATLEIVTTPPALAMLKQAGILPNMPAEAVILDNAAGAGCVAATIFQSLENDGVHLDSLRGLKIIAGDLEPTMVANLNQRIKAKGWEKIVEGRVVDAQKLSFPDEHFTHVVLNCGPQIMPDQAAFGRETFRVLRQGGTAGFTSWVHMGWFPSIKAVFPAFAYPPQLAELWTKPDVITEDLTALGYKDIVVTPLVFKTKQKVSAMVDALTTVIPFLRSPQGKELYEAYLHERADSDGDIELEWESRVITAKK